MFLLIRKKTGQIIYAILINRIKEIYAHSEKDSEGKYFYKSINLKYDDEDTEVYEDSYDLNDLMSQIEKLGV